jgi:hypothetical protein
MHKEVGSIRSIDRRGLPARPTWHLAPSPGYLPSPLFDFEKDKSQKRTVRTSCQFPQLHVTSVITALKSSLGSGGVLAFGMGESVH